MQGFASTLGVREFSGPSSASYYLLVYTPKGLCMTRAFNVRVPFDRNLCSARAGSSAPSTHQRTLRALTGPKCE